MGGESWNTTLLSGVESSVDVDLGLKRDDLCFSTLFSCLNLFSFSRATSNMSTSLTLLSSSGNSSQYFLYFSLGLGTTSTTSSSLLSPGLSRGITSISSVSRSYWKPVGEAGPSTPDSFFLTRGITSISSLSKFNWIPVGLEGLSKSSRLIFGLLDEIDNNGS